MSPSPWGLRVLRGYLTGLDLFRHLYRARYDDLEGLRAMAWEGSTRRDRLPADWQAVRLRVLRRDGYRCQIADTNGIPCLAPAREVDHIQRGDDHSPANLQAACRSCHALKSSKEGNDARERRRRPRESHPGMV